MDKDKNHYSVAEVNRRAEERRLQLKAPLTPLEENAALFTLRTQLQGFLNNQVREGKKVSYDSAFTLTLEDKCAVDRQEAYHPVLDKLMSEFNQGDEKDEFYAFDGTAKGDKLIYYIGVREKKKKVVDEPVYPAPCQDECEDDREMGTMYYPPVEEDEAVYPYM